jgi:hypothetical protein
MRLRRELRRIEDGGADGQDLAEVQRSSRKKGSPRASSLSPMRGARSRAPISVPVAATIARPRSRMPSGTGKSLASAAAITCSTKSSTKR